LANRKRRKDFAALGFAEGELKDALANEHRPAKRRRLLGLKALLDGHTEVEAAKLADTSPNSIVRWRKLLLSGGLGAVLTDATRARPMKPELVAKIRTEIAAALAQEPPPRARLRLTGIDAALAGVPLDRAAALAQVKTDTLNQWLREIRLRGIAGVLPKPRRADHRPKIDADPANLHALASSEQDRYVRKRLLGLAYVAEGFSTHDAAIRATLGVTTLVKHLRLFQQGGITAICSNPRRGPSPRLRPKELQIVSDLLRTPPVMAAEQMCAYIEAEFGVRYTPNGLKSMLKKQFGFVYRPA
jgi:transposase